MSAGYRETVQNLASLESFDPRVFVESREWSKELCDLILAFAVAHNDYSDIDFGLTLRNKVMPSPPDALSPEVLFHKGLGIHLIKLLAALLHELLAVIKQNRAVIEGPAFAKLVATLPKILKPIWADVVQTALDPTANNDFARMVLIARNKVAFHYDPRLIGIAYRERFMRTPDPETPYISRGVTLAKTRYYFADAIAEQTIFRGASNVAENFSAESIR
jgi:hypothetical protein